MKRILFAGLGWLLLTVALALGLLALATKNATDAMLFVIVGGFAWLYVSLLGIALWVGWKSLVQSRDQDGLTGLFNKRCLLATLAKWQKEKRSFGVLMIDMDFFKQVNDTHGHLAGDAVLQRLAVTLQHAVRGDDAVFRYGGEEFVVLLANQTTIGNVEKVAERIRKTVSFTAFPYVLQKTCSIGCTVSSAGETPERLLAIADDALYQAKKQGRNCVVSNVLKKGAVEHGE